MAPRSTSRRKTRGATPAALLGLLLVAAAWAETRYVPPTRDIVVNAPVVAKAGQTVHLPLYFSDSGRYYAQLLPEASDGAVDDPAGTLAGVALNVRVSRDDEVLFEREFTGGPPGEQTGTTVLWLEVPDDLPQRRELDLALSFQAVPPTLAGDPLRFQLTRKVHFPPVRPF